MYRYNTAFISGNNGTSNDGMKLVGIVLPSEVSTSTTRKSDIISKLQFKNICVC